MQTFPPNSYFTYPHSNGFTRSGLVYGRLLNKDNLLVRRDFETGIDTVLFTAPVPESGCLWYDVAPEVNLMVTVSGKDLVLIPLEEPEKKRTLYSAPAGCSLDGIMSLKRDGSRVLMGESRPDSVKAAVEFDVFGGAARTLFSHTWWANHFHYCPHDENWIAFCHEGPTRTIPDRVWGWHAVLAPAGRCLFDQQSGTPGVPLCVGHERWCFHDTAALAIAYGDSAAGPRGLYEIFADERLPRLVSEGDRDWHCNISLDGTLAVVDTTGSYAMPGKGWENDDRRSDIILIDMLTGARRHLFRTGEHRAGYSHPFHPHPAISPDKSYVIFNDCIPFIDGIFPAVRQFDI